MAGTQIDERLNGIGALLREQPSVVDAVKRRVADVAPPVGQSFRLGPFGRVLALAACAVLAVGLWSVLIGRGGRGGMLGATEAFAAAIENVAKAKSFSARQTSTFIDEDGKQAVHEMAIAFIAPNLQRIEWLKGLPRQVIITDFSSRRRVMIVPDDKVAVMQDISALYQADDSGNVNPMRLDQRIRERVLKITANAARDLGMAKLDGKNVRVLQSDDGGGVEPVKKVYVDPKTNAPVRIELSWASAKSTITFSDIFIDAELDPRLFSFDVPADYMVQKDEGHGQRDHINGKMAAKMMRLTRACIEYASGHGGTFPESLDDLNQSMTPAALKTLLAAPGRPDGPAVIEYRRPRKGKDAADEIIVYEAKPFRRDGKVVAGFGDGHTQVMSGEEFEKQTQ